MSNVFQYNKILIDCVFGNRKFVVPSTLTIDLGFASVNNQCLGDNKLAIPEYTVYKYFKKIAPSGGRPEIVLGISCEKSRFYAKRILFFPILGEGGGGGGAPGPPPPPPWIHPWAGWLVYGF